MSFQEFAQTMRRASLEARPALYGIAQGAAEEGEAFSRGLIGQERPEWRPLARRTIREKLEEGFGGQVSATDPLLRTGKMRSSISGKAVRLPTGVAIVIGSADPVARDQELGTARIPPRPFLAAAMVAIEPLVVKSLAKAAGAILNPKLWGESE